MDYIKNFSWNSNNSSEGESIQLKSGTDDLYSNNNSCLNKIKNFFEDYLMQLKKAKEYEELKKKLEEEARIEEQKEKERRERFILPKINKFELIEIKENSELFFLQE